MDSKIKEWIKIARKFSRFLLHTTSASEEEELKQWTEKHQRLLQELNSPSYYTQQALRRNQLQRKYSWEQFVADQKQKIRIRRLRTLRYAASVVILLTAGIAIWLLNPDQSATTYVAALPQFTPGSAKASLVLNDGQEISLDNQLTFTEKDGTIIRNSETGELAYQTDITQDTALRYNTLKVPRGGEYRVTLADGTKVWINSESELSFPTRFNGSTREVYLKGEAYFEIAPNKKQPFYVNNNQLQVHATGTAFDVIAYQDEPELKVILTEGKVNIENKQQILSQLTPNQQFAWNKENGQFTVSTIDPRTATAWKDGNFFFSDEPLESIIRKLARWYNVEIECAEPEIRTYKFSGEIRKYEDATQVLNMLKLTNEIHYSIEANKKIKIYATK